MAPRKFMSGAQKRKLKEKSQKELNDIRGSLDSYFHASSAKSVDQEKPSDKLNTIETNDEVDITCENTIPVKRSRSNQCVPEQEYNSTVSISAFTVVSENDSKLENKTNNDMNDLESEIVIQDDYDKKMTTGIISYIDLDINSAFPTDRGKFPETINDANLKRKIILFGPCKPNIKFPENPSTYIDNMDFKPRTFSSEYYFVTNPTGIKIPRPWLCYSVDLNKVYCETCWLFADRRNPKFKLNWINGVNDWQHISQKIKVHEISIQHIEAVKIRIIWVKNQTIDRELQEQISEEAKYWRDILLRLIKIILYLTSGNMALRGNEGKTEDIDDEGNFMRTVKLMADFDPILNKLLYKEVTKIKYLSWKVQNELINLLATNVRILICDEIRSAQCFSIIMDSTQDISKVDQVSFILRYVVVNYIDHTFEIKESFLGFFTIDKHGAENQVNLMKNLLNMFNLDLYKCRGQGYDGAAVMSGIHSGVQKRVTDLIPSASYVHCAAHNLNLVLCSLAKSSQKMSQLFDTVQDIFLFFNKSAPRWASLALGNDVAKVVLKKVCTTRWEAKHNAIYALKTRYIDVLKSLTNLSLTSKSDEQSKAIGLKKKIESFEFILLLTIWENILRNFHFVSKKLQRTDMNLHDACEFLNQATSSIENLRNQYEELVSSASDQCNKWKVPIRQTIHRRVYTRRVFDDVDGDRRLDISEENIRVMIFLPVIDTAIAQLKERFIGLYEVTNRFNFLIPQNILKFSENDIVKASYDFQLFYKTDISTDITRQMLCIKGVLKDSLKTIHSIKGLLQCILDNDMASTYNDILSACIIFITLPVTVANAERSFSKLKIIKNYLRNSMSQDRLTNISVLNIEQKRTKELDIDNIIEVFANSKARKKNFLK